MRILVTGANGFVGRELCKTLRLQGYEVRAAARHASNGDSVQIGNIGPETDWSYALSGVDTIVHLAARVHIMQEMSKNPLESFRSVNVLGSGRLALMAAKVGVKRFVYVSSISVHGNSTGERAYAEEDETQPHSPYAISKWEGELALRRIAEDFGFDLVIVRPPLVYGPGVGGNFMRLMRWADRGWPLPLGSARNLRSFIGIDNLVDLLVRCLEHPKAPGETFLVADGEDLSTPDLIRRLADHLGRPARIISFPVGILQAVAKISGQGDVMDRLCNCLRVNAEKARRVLGWQPLVPLDEGLKRTANWYVKECRGRTYPL